jgi:bacteriorhodopsin
MNLENFVTYSPEGYAIVAQLLTLGYAAMAAGLVYFLATSGRTAPQYRLSSTLSAVVMASAFLELYVQSQEWERSFVATPEGFVRNGPEVFSNGYRYMNWTIDVPMLLLQLLVVLGFSYKQGRGLWSKMALASLAMIYTGYVGQFYETTSVTRLLVWGAISTVFFIYVLYLLWTTIERKLPDLSAEAGRWLRALRWVAVGSWLLYPGAYLAPLLALYVPDLAETAVVARQLTYTVADIVSKVVYGVVLGLVAEQRSSDEGFVPAMVGQNQARVRAEPTQQLSKTSSAEEQRSRKETLINATNPGGQR